MSDTVERYFTAMQRGREGHEELLGLFAPDAVWVDAFGGGEHAGHAAIDRWLAATADQAPPDFRLTVDRVDVDGDEVVAAWTCESPAFAAPARGSDRFVVRDGKIVRLESTLVEPPTLR
jgi:uncharacterized protein (TIGR02246 family)